MWRFEACRGRPGDAGYVTAEAAVVLPVLVVFTGMLLWGLMTAAAQIRCVDAARAGARAAARSEPPEAAMAAAVSAGPPGAKVVLRREGDLVRVRVAARSLGPGRLAGLLSVTVGADAVALAEEAVR
ncbi:TadE family type IV pilus minor pilin [Streptomyces sp. ICBB 8177]|uniref:TadE family type IV pilus minor pilin n=1 Tax=Streptomyces sp. ICBB 8177 TaxID=563922 RepID=UPI000D67AFCC|nr:TadE family type IV pilus minor pilin [Streptomyces sp. ICBB 8177]PWI42465.1 hypothetical protein CK485_08900 [Streptomyces sp. ICBB 8177]